MDRLADGERTTRRRSISLAKKADAARALEQEEVVLADVLCLRSAKSPRDYKRRKRFAGVVVARDRGGPRGPLHVPSS